MVFKDSESDGPDSIEVTRIRQDGPAKELQMTWTADEVRHLRYRLGWSCADLAHTLGCELTQVLDWEAGRSPLLDCYRNHLLHFYNQAEVNAEKVQRRPVAEYLMEDRGLSQIHESEVIDCLALGSLSHLTFKA